MEEYVTILVISYNSGKTILETLESAKNQSWANLDLVVSDDGSKDDTVHLAEKWLDENRNRFRRFVIVKSKENTGISANANRGENECNTDWVMRVDADDILFPNCVEDFVDGIKNFPDEIFFFGKVKVFGGSEAQRKNHNASINYDYFSGSLGDQRDGLRNGQFLPPSSFYNLACLRELGIDHDERIPMLDDLPRYYRVVLSGHRLILIDKYVVRYRAGGVCQSPKWEQLVGVKSLRLFYFYYIFPQNYLKSVEDAVNEVVNYEISVLNLIKESKSYRLGKLLTKPMRWFKSLFKSNDRK